MPPIVPGSTSEETANLTAHEAASLLSQGVTEGDQPGEEEQASPVEDVESEEHPEPDSEGEVEVFEADDGGNEEPEFYDETLIELQSGERVTLEELQKGYLRNRDYTQKTQDLSSERKRLEEAESKTRESEQRYSQALAVLEQRLTQEELKEPDPELYGQDPLEYLRQQNEVREKREKLQAVQQERQRVHQDQLNKAQENFQRELPNVIPEWNDPDTYNAEAAKIRTHATKTLGFDEAQLASTFDPRVFNALRKAMLYDEMMSGKGVKAKKKAKKAPKVIKSGPATPPTREVDVRLKKAEEKLVKSGDIWDAVDVVLNREQKRQRA